MWTGLWPALRMGASLVLWTLSGLHPDFSGYTEQQDQYQNFTVRLMQSKSPFQRLRLACFQSNTVFLKVYNSILYSLHTHKIWKRSEEKYKSYGTLSKTTHFHNVFCEVGVVQQCTEAQADKVQDGFNFKGTFCLFASSCLNFFQQNLK